MRGGWMAKVSKDLFVLPTRGFRELLASLRLRAIGVSTPEVVAYVSYPLNWVVRRSDVATREIPNGHDLSVALAKVTDHAHRVMVLDAIAKLLRSLTQAGAHHQRFVAHRLVDPLDLRAERAEPLVDSLVTALDLPDIVNDAGPVGGERRQEHPHAGADVGRVDGDALEGGGPRDDGAVGIAENDAGRLTIPDLELEVGLIDGWVRYWHRGALLSLPGELLNQLRAKDDQLDAARERISDQEAENARLRDELAKLKAR